MKFCRDCKYLSTWNRCRKQLDPVTGEAFEQGHGWRGSPTAHREDGFLTSFICNSCGKRGRWWEPKSELPKNDKSI